MRNSHLSIAFGLILSAGLAIAQTPSQNQTDPAQQGAQASPLTTESAPSAQQGRQAPNPERAAHHLGKQLGLSKDQVAQIEPIIADRQQQVASVRADSSLAPRDRRAKLRSIQEDSRNKIEALLTDSQKQQFEQMLQNRRAQHQQQQPPQAQ
jgi:periplasmic protein CpxP/Spy